MGSSRRRSEVTFRQAEPDLTALLRDFGPPRKSADLAADEGLLLAPLLWLLPDRILAPGQGCRVTGQGLLDCSEKYRALNLSICLILSIITLSCSEVATFRTRAFASASVTRRIR